MAEVEGEMPALISIAQLADWGFNLYAATGRADFTELDLRDVEMERSGTGILRLSLLEYYHKSLPCDAAGFRRCELA